MSDQRDDERRPEWLEDGLRVGEWFVEPQRNRITWCGAAEATPAGERHVCLEPKVMQVLVCMVRRPGKTITKKAFMEEVWSDTVVSNDALLRCISELRSALGDDARAPDYVETIRKVGYRLIAPVSYPAPAGKADGPEETKNEFSPAAPAPTSPASAPAGRRTNEGNTARRRLRRLTDGTTLGRRPLWAGGLLAALLLVAGAFALRGWLAPGVPAPSQAVPFTSFPGEEFDSALSPEGERVAFVWNGGDEEDGARTEERRFDIYVKQREAGKPLRITDTPEREYSPAWSPGGKRLAFLRAGEEGTELIIAPAAASAGGKERAVARFTEREVRSVVWSPRGDTLALSVQQRPYGAFRLVLLTPADGRRRVLTAPPDHYRGDVTPAFSPDGKTLAFARGVVDRVQDLYTVPVSGGTPTRLTRDRAAVSGLDWTTDGRSIVFASDREGTSRLWRVGAGGGVPTWIATDTGGGLYQPSIARRGVRMTLTERSLDMNIWRLHPVAGYDRLASHRLLSSTRWESYPAVAPGGERLAFASKRSGSFELWTSRRDGTDPVQLTRFEGPFVSAPRFSPDGERIVFCVQGEDGADVYMTDAEGAAAPRPLTRAPASDVAPRFSRDGRWVYFASNRSGRWQVWKQPAGGGGAAQRVTEAGGFAAQESPDGGHLYYTKRDEPGLWRRPLTNDTLESGGLLDLLKDTFTGASGEERVIDVLEPFDWGNWDVTERGLYYVSRERERPALMYRTLQGGAPVRMAYLDGLPRHPSLAVAPDGRWFLHAKVERNESDILLVERFR